MLLRQHLPADWSGFKIHYRYRETVYHLAVTQTPTGEGASSGVVRVTVDGVQQQEQTIQLVDDQPEHRVDVSVPVRVWPKVPN